MAAEVLFDEGVELMKAGQFQQACGKIAESHRLEPRAGTLFTLAECWSRAGRPATALARYREYLRRYERMPERLQREQRGRDEIARNKLRELDGEVSRLRITLATPTPDGTVVKRDGVVVGSAALGVWLPLDPGGYVLHAAAPKGPPSVLRVELGAGERRDVRLKVQSAPAPVAAPAPEIVVPTAVVKAQPSVARQSGGELSELLIGAIALGSAAAAALIAGTVTGVMSLDQAAKAEAGCNLGGRPGWCDEAGEAAANRATALAHASTASFVIGAAAGGTAVTLVVVDGVSDSEHPGAAAMFWLGYTARW